MALRRPAKPRTDRVHITPATPVENTPAEDAPVKTGPVVTVGGDPAVPTGAPAGAPRRPARRLVLLGAAAAGTVGAAAAGTLWAMRARRPDAGTAAAAQPGGAAPATDLAADDPRRESMLWAQRTGVLPARADGSLDPDGALARHELAQALYAFAGSPDLDVTAAPALFTDLPEDPAQARAVLWLHGRAALWGDDRLRFRPDAEATRDEVAGIVGALLRPGLRGLSFAITTVPAARMPYTDLRADDPSAADVLWLLGAGIVDASDRWGGDAPMLRGDLALLLHRAQDLIASAVG